MLPAKARVFVACQPIDFRGSFERLAGYVRERLGADPRSGDLFIFLNRAGDKLKLLFFDQTGDCILYKRLDQRSFHGVVSIDTETQRVEVDAKQLMTILRGVERPTKIRH